MFDWYSQSPNPDELYHWKYKRRYRGPSGDWVYIYDDGSSSDAGVTINTYSEKDVYGNTEVRKQKVITDPKKWLSTKTTSEKVDTKTVVENGQAKTTTKHTTTETVERGKFHIMKMNLERKISEIPRNIARNLKKDIEWNKHISKDKNYQKKSSFDVMGDYKKWNRQYKKKHADN